MSVKLEACLRLLGFEAGEEIDFDHHPALELRPVNADGTDTDPPQHDPNYIRPLRRHTEHKLKTNGRRGTSDLSIDSNADKARIAKAKRLEEETFRRRLLETDRFVEEHKRPERPKSRWPKRKLQGRPFPKRGSKS